MEEKNIGKKMNLVHRQSSYKLVIPQEVEQKIRLLCREIHDIEWSGVLFYKKEGNFEDNTLVITCVDIFQMDEGSSAYTEYVMNADVVNYEVKHPELLEPDVYQGLIHSHNQMSTFFSGTDTSTLLSEGNDMNHFVSLIVNNRGIYTAGITRRVTKIINGTETIRYNTWNDSSITVDSTPIIQEETYIEWYNLDIEVEKVQNDFEGEMLARMKEIRDNKFPEPKNHLVPTTTPYTTLKDNNSFIDSPAAYNNYSKDLRLQTSSKDSLFNNEEMGIDYKNLKLNPEIIDWVVKQSLTCSVIISSSSKIDKEKWAKSMDKLYSERFESVEEFEVFATSFIDYLVNYTKDSEASEYLDATEMAAILAYQVVEELNKLPKNKWLNKLMELYDDYIL